MHNFHNHSVSTLVQTPEPVIEWGNLPCMVQSQLLGGAIYQLYGPFHYMDCGPEPVMSGPYIWLWAKLKSTKSSDG